MRIDVLGVGFDNLTMAEAVARGAALLEEPGCHYVATPNPEIVEVCRENPEAMKAVNGADLVLPVLLCLVLRALNVDSLVLGIAVTQMAMPVAVNGSLLCMEYGGDTQCMAQATLLTTVGSILTIPLIAAMLL